MSAATKCDICGAFYYERTEEEKYAAIEIISPQSEKFYGCKEMDCCPKCTAKLEEFIDILKSGLNYCIWVDDAGLTNKE